jgi:lipoate synthase
MNYFQCSKCKQSLSEDCFFPSKRRKGSWCKECFRKRDQLPEVKERKRLAAERYRKENPQKVRDSYQKSRYKLTDEQLAALKAVEICQNPGCNNPATCIDHCHDSLQVRGRLCNKCNLALGHLNDDPAKITGLLEYLKAQ